MAIITLTTDFGSRDGYVGAVKGVLARRAPDAHIVDIAHDIPAGDIAHAAWVVRTACRVFPTGTVHLVVVDPGVGGTRGEVAVHAGGQYYVGPNNGVFGYLTDLTEHAVPIINDTGGPSRPSPTFHGRDIFAYAAAALAKGESVGRHAVAIERLPFGDRPEGEGRIVHVDHFGNLISDLPAKEAGEAIAIAGHTLPVQRTYGDVAPGELLAYIGSARTVEVAVRDGRADKRLDAPRGTRIVPVARVVGPFR